MGGHDELIHYIVNQVAVSLETARAARLEAAVQATLQQRDLDERFLMSCGESPRS